jgi:hypothetical protein
MDIGSLRFADFNGAFCTGISPPVPLFTKRNEMRYKSNRHRKHYTSFEQVFYPFAVVAKQQILKYHLLKFHPSYAAHKVLFQTSERWCAPWGRKFKQQSRR